MRPITEHRIGCLKYINTFIAWLAHRLTLPISVYRICCLPTIRDADWLRLQSLPLADLQSVHAAYWSRLPVREPDARGVRHEDGVHGDQPLRPQAMPPGT